MAQCRVPGKLFLIGEYGVIDGGTALLAAIRPGFTYISGNAFVHPESPLGKHAAQFGTSNQIELQRLGSLAPGFGTSTAELIAALYFEKNEEPDLEETWSWYKSIFPKTSGADLLVQIEAMKKKQGFFRVTSRNKITSLPQSKLFDQIFLFQTHVNEKMATHVALAQVGQMMSLEHLNAYSEKLEKAFFENDEASLSVLAEFADYLSSFGLESEHSTRVRKSFSAFPGILGVKGCGAGLHDVFMVAVQSDCIADTQIKLTLAVLTEMAQKHRLNFLGSLTECLW